MNCPRNARIKIICALVLLSAGLGAGATNTRETGDLPPVVQITPGQTIDDVVRALGIGTGNQSPGGGDHFTAIGSYITQEDFSNGWYDENGVIDTSPSFGGVGPTTQEKTAFAWNGGIDTTGTLRRGFKEDWNVYRIWVQTTGPWSPASFVGGSLDYHVPFIVDPHGSGLFHSTTGIATPVPTAQLQFWTGNIGDELYRFGFDSFMTLGSASFIDGITVVDVSNAIERFEAPCEGGIDEENFGVFRLTEEGQNVGVPDPYGQYRVLVGQYAVRKGYLFTGQMRFGGSGNTFDTTWSTAGGTNNSAPLALVPLGNATLSMRNGNVVVSNIGSTGLDGMGVNFDSAGADVLEEGYGVGVQSVDLAAAGAGAAFIAQCGLTNCFSTLFDPFVVVENQTELGLVIGTANFPMCNSATIEIWNNGLFQGMWTVPDGNLFEITNTGPGSASSPDEVSCVGTELRLLYHDSRVLRIIVADTLVDADDIRLTPAGCNDALFVDDDGPPLVRQLSVRMRNIPEFSATEGAFDPMCAGDVAPPGGDGMRNVEDFLAIINAFGMCETCAEDVNPLNQPNGQVNIDDLIFVLNRFGPCNAL
jgi:hypothetical protein